MAVVLALLATGLGIAVLFSETAGAAWPGRPGPIVYLGVRPETSNTACCSPYKTTGLRELRGGAASWTPVLTEDPTDADPQVSPDGETIVFSREIPSGLPFPLPAIVRGIFAIDIDGSGLRQLTAGAEGESDVEPAFYPSGESIVFARGRAGIGQGDLYSIRLDGSRLRQVTRGPRRERAPAVSPNGRQIAFTCGPGGEYGNVEDVCSIRPDGTHRRLLTRALKRGAEPFDPDFSPSGRLIAFTLGPGTASDVFTMRADGSRLGALTNRSPSGRRTFPRHTGYASPSFSPSGSSLVALARPGAGPHLVRIRLGDPRHPQPIGDKLGSSPVWAVR